LTHIHGIILDVDGTLVESNDAQAQSWVEAMAEHGYSVPYEKVRRLIGKGGDKVLPETIGVEKDSDEGKQISDRRGEIYKQRFLPTLKPTPGARALLEEMRRRGLKLSVASSAPPDELKASLQIVGASDLVEETSSSKDAKESKPAPNIVEATLKKMGYPADEVVMLGDTPYDIEAAQKISINTIAVRCGGWSDTELDGAIAIYEDPADLLAHYDSSPLAK
jgi:HAD superfamily hydrolase (TIGR01509 family)